ncbi:MAG: hypothetical protein MJZ26_07660 [Fibrobacter sp.]|nr:hypothetical protein [Fibrobacter sp.]
MLDSKLLDILCCPETRAALKLASSERLAAVNNAISAGSLKNVGGEVVTETLTEALETVDGSRLYPVREGIPVLLSDEAIML